MINQQEEEQLRSQGVPNIRMILLTFPFIPNIILILGIKGKASGFPRCTCAVAGSGFNFFMDRGVGRRNWREDILSSMIKSKGRMNWKHWLVWSFLTLLILWIIVSMRWDFIFLNWSIANKLKKYCRTPRDPRCNSNSDNLSSPLIETISLGFFSHFYSANLILDNSNFSLTRTKFHLRWSKFTPITRILAVYRSPGMPSH